MRRDLREAGGGEAGFEIIPRIEARDVAAVSGLRGIAIPGVDGEIRSLLSKTF